MPVSDRKVVFHYREKKWLFSPHLCVTSEKSTINLISIFIDNTEILWCLFAGWNFMALDLLFSSSLSFTSAWTRPFPGRMQVECLDPVCTAPSSASQGHGLICRPVSSGGWCMMAWGYVETLTGIGQVGRFGWRTTEALFAFSLPNTWLGIRNVWAHTIWLFLL